MNNPPLIRPANLDRLKYCDRHEVVLPCEQCEDEEPSAEDVFERALCAVHPVDPL